MEVIRAGQSGNVGRLRAAEGDAVPAVCCCRSGSRPSPYYLDAEQPIRSFPQVGSWRRGAGTSVAPCGCCSAVAQSREPEVAAPEAWQDVHMADDVSIARRKQLRVGHVSERGGVNAVRTLLEAHGHVVDEVDARSDYGRDLIVDLTESSEITGAVIGVQVKGDRSFIKNGDWELPASMKDRRYWAESSVPIVGVLWNPVDGEMRWANLTAYARADPAISTWPPRRSPSISTEEPPGVSIVYFTENKVLDGTTLSQMIEQLRDYLRQSSAPALLGLFDPDDERRRNAVFDCWVLGRSDARAFILLRWALPSLSGQTLRYAVTILSHLTPHPDIFWHAGNWVPPEIERQVRPAFRWSAPEVCDLVCAVDQLDEGAGWQRGSLGQCLWSLLVVDPTLFMSVHAAIGLALAREELDAAFRLLIIYQYLADDSLTAVKDALIQYPQLRSHEFTNDLVQQIANSGRMDVY